MYALNKPILLIGSSSSDCGMCGKGANPYAKTHDRIMAYGPNNGEPGCGVEWTQVTSFYYGVEDIVKQMRPDLEYVTVLDWNPQT